MKVDIFPISQVLRPPVLENGCEELEKIGKLASQIYKVILNLTFTRNYFSISLQNLFHTFT